jgi:hypothetical protein
LICQNDLEEIDTPTMPQPKSNVTTLIIRFMGLRAIGVQYVYWISFVFLTSKQQKSSLWRALIGYDAGQAFARPVFCSHRWRRRESNAPKAHKPALRRSFIRLWRTAFVFRIGPANRALFRILEISPAFLPKNNPGSSQ